VLLKVKDGTMRIFKDDQLVVVYRVAPGKGNVVADPRFYERLRSDQEQQRRKYHRCLVGKAKATRGLLADGLHWQVMARSLAVYDQLVRKEVPPCQS